MSVDTRLHNVYLISGGYDHEKKEVIEKSAVPVANAFFVRMNHKEHTLITTDDNGMLCSIYSSGEKAQRINDNNLGPMQLCPIPPNLARRAYFVSDKDWQRKLVENVRELSLPTPLEPIPVSFTSAHLRAPGQDSDEKKVSQYFERQQTCQGQLIPRLRVLTVLIDRTCLASVPGSLTARLGKESITLHAASKAVSLSINDHVTAKFAVYAATGADMKDGSYVVSVPASALDHDWVHASHGKKDVFERTLQVTFAVHTLFGDFDFQVFDLPSVEDALLTHFTERYTHLLVDPEPSSKQADPIYAQAVSTLARYTSVATVLNEKRKMVVGFVNAEVSEKAKAITNAALGAIKDSNTKGFSEAAAIASNMLTQAYQAKDLVESWKKLSDKWRITRAFAKELNLVEHVMGADTVSKFYAKAKWRDATINAIRDVEEKKGSLLGRYILLRKENADPALLKKLMKNATSPKVPAWEDAARAELESKALWALDVGVSIYQIASTANELHSLHENEKLQEDRLQNNMEQYGKRFGHAPCAEVVARLEVLRKAADAAVMSTDEKAMEAVEQAGKLVLKALTFVPVVGEFAAIAGLAVESMELAGNVIDTTGDLVDRFIFRYRSSKARFEELAKLHAVQCRAISKAGKSKHNDPYTQFRVRLIVLIGLLRLIERCGSRLGDPDVVAAKFAAKVDQYKIDGYLRHYLFSSESHFVELSSGTPLDEVWLYTCGSKKTDWNDLMASLPSVTDSVIDLVRGTKTVLAPVAFQKHFPIHGMGAKDAFALASAFSLNFSGVMDRNLVYSRIYAREDKDKDEKKKWVPIESFGHPIAPGTAIRIAAVFKSKEDLTGTPMSLQIVRVDSILNSYGPVYKSSLTRVTKSLENGFDDKGLLDYIEEEKRYSEDKSAYSCVFYPFYFFQNKMIHGVKPFGYIGLSGDINLDFSFDLKAGDDGKYVETNADSAKHAKKEGRLAGLLLPICPIAAAFVAGKAASDEAKGRTVRMHLSTSNRTHIDMILNREFLDNKTATQNYENMFNFPWQEFQIGGVFMRFGWTTPKIPANWMPGTQKDKTYEFDRPASFQWEKPVELLLIFGAPFTASDRWQGDPIRFPSRIYTKVPTWFGMSSNDGPSFPVEIFSIKRGQRFRTIDQKDFLPALRDAGLWSDSDVWLPAAHMTFTKECQVWATRISFNYHVEGMNGILVDRPGLRPFGEKYINEKSLEKYTFTFDIRSPGPIGLDIRDFVRLIVPGLPEEYLAGTALAGDSSWVTDKSRWDLTELEKFKSKDKK
jgi:hypothetical protein